MIKQCRVLSRLSFASRINSLQHCFSSMVPPPSWSLKDLQLCDTENTESVISEDRVKYLSRLACIDLGDSKDVYTDVAHDVNVLLRCAEAMKTMNIAGIEEGVVEADTVLTIPSLREDRPEECDKQAIFRNAPKRHGDYFVVPKVKDTIS